MTGIFAIIAVYNIVYHFVYWKLVKPDFKGKTVFITGASSGIGEELAVRMSNLGTKRIYIAARRVNELERVKTLCSK